MAIQKLTLWLGTHTRKHTGSVNAQPAGDYESSRCYLACLGYSSSEQREISALIELPLDQREMGDKQKLISKVSGMFAGDQYCGKKEVVQSKGIRNMEVAVRFYLCSNSISQAAVLGMNC